MSPLLLSLALALGAATPARPAAPPRPAATTAATAAGTYVVRAVNGQRLPFQDRVATAPGFEHRARLERAFVRLDRNGTYALTAWYAYAHLPAGTPLGAAPLHDDVLRGRWSLDGTTITLTPEKKGRRSRPSVGRLANGQISLTFHLANGVVARDWTVVATFDPSYL